MTEYLRRPKIVVHRGSPWLLEADRACGRLRAEDRAESRAALPAG